MDDRLATQLHAALVLELGKSQLALLLHLQREMERCNRPVQEKTWLQAAIHQLDTALGQVGGQRSLGHAGSIKG